MKNSQSRRGPNNGATEQAVSQVPVIVMMLLFLRRTGKIRDRTSAPWFLPNLWADAVRSSAYTLAKQRDDCTVAEQARMLASNVRTVNEILRTSFVGKSVGLRQEHSRQISNRHSERPWTLGPLRSSFKPLIDCLAGTTQHFTMIRITEC